MTLMFGNDTWERIMDFYLENEVRALRSLRYLSDDPSNLLYVSKTKEGAGLSWSEVVRIQGFLGEMGESC